MNHIKKINHTSNLIYTKIKIHLIFYFFGINTYDLSQADVLCGQLISFILVKKIKKKTINICN